MKTTDHALTFFRVFDLAFFAPGTVIVATCLWIWSDDLFDATEVDLATPAGILGVLLGIGAIYSAGLVTHSLTWRVRRVLQRKGEGPEEVSIESAGWPPLPLYFGDALRDDLILYFWYLRATCWNVATALLISAILVTFDQWELNCTVGLCWLGAFSLCTFLVIQGRGYDAQVNRSLASRVRAMKPSGSVKASDNGDE